MTALAPESTEAVPDRVVPCWVGRWYPDAGLCVNWIAEWWTNNGASPQWQPTCTGCKDRFLRLNPRTLVRPL